MESFVMLASEFVFGWTFLIVETCVVVAAFVVYIVFRLLGR